VTPPLRAVFALLAATSLAGLVVGGLAAAQLRGRLASGPPLARPTDLAVAPDGTLYVALDAGRVQVYDAEGRYLRGWRLDRGAGPSRLRIAAPGRIEVATSGSARLHAFDAEGRLLGSVEDAGAFARFGAEAPAGGASHALEAGAVVRLRPPPPHVLVPATPRPLAWFASAPIPALTALLTASGLGLVFGIALAGSRRSVSA
jgi:hypothetical protein